MKLTLAATLLIVSFVLAPVCSSGAIWEVRNAAELQFALDQAERNGVFDTIRIFQGNYEGHFTYHEEGSEKNKMTTLKGGFSDETDPSDDPGKTILDGTGTGTVLECNVQGSIVIQNLTFQNGNGGAAGGLFINLPAVEKPGTALIMNNFFLNNYSDNQGGGLKAQAINPAGKASNIWLIENRISGNQAFGIESGGGGGAYLYIDAGSISKTTGHIVALGNTVTTNMSLGGSGGGLHLWSRSDSGLAGRIMVKGNTVIDNLIERADGDTRGGGINVYSQSWGEELQDQYSKNLNMISFEDNTIQENQVYGGCCGGASITSASQTVPAACISVKRNDISENYVGGGAYAGLAVSSAANFARSGEIVVKRNLISNNQSTIAVGGASVSSISYSGDVKKNGAVLLANNFIVENSTGFRSDQMVGGLSAGGNVTLIHNTIAFNYCSSSESGVGGLQLIDLEPGCEINVYNNIIWGNIVNQGPEDILFYFDSGTYNGFNNDYGDMEGAWTSFGGNINVDPRFKGNGDYHLQFSSPCRNSGTAGAPHMPATDYDGHNRVMGGAPDMGADELLDLYRAKYLQVKRPLKLKNLLKKVNRD